MYKVKLELSWSFKLRSLTAITVCLMFVVIQLSWFLTVTVAVPTVAFEVDSGGSL
jgi:hypothetical protein